MRIHPWPSLKCNKRLARYIVRQGISTTLKMYTILNIFTIEHMVNLSDSPSGFLYVPLKHHKHMWTWWLMPPKKGHIETPCFLVAKTWSQIGSYSIPSMGMVYLYVYLHEWWNFMANVGIYTVPPMDAICIMDSKNPTSHGVPSENPQKLCLFSPRQGSDLQVTGGWISNHKGQFVGTS